jgi:hypothetical protein
VPKEVIPGKATCVIYTLLQSIMISFRCLWKITAYSSHTCYNQVLCATVYQKHSVMMCTGTMLFRVTTSASQIWHTMSRTTHFNGLNCIAGTNLIFDKLFLCLHSEILTLLRKTYSFQGGYLLSFIKKLLKIYVCVL